jgi:hypothetical protein
MRNVTHTDKLGRVAEDLAIIKLSTLFEDCIVSHVVNNQLHDIEIRKRIDVVLQKASPNKPIRDSNGNVINGYDKFENSAKNKKNSTYVKLAKEIYSIYWDELNKIYEKN